MKRKLWRIDVPGIPTGLYAASPNGAKHLAEDMEGTASYFGFVDELNAQEKLARTARIINKWEEDRAAKGLGRCPHRAMIVCANDNSCNCDRCGWGPKGEAICEARLEKLKGAKSNGKGKA